MAFATPVVVGREAEMPFADAHDVTAKGLVVHIKIRFQKKYRTQLFCLKIVLLFKELDVDTFFPSGIGEACHICD